LCRDVVGIILCIAAVLTLRQLALAAFQIGDDAADAAGVDMAAGQQTWYHSARGVGLRAGYPSSPRAAAGDRPADLMFAVKDTT
jgi:hypothetical protein